MVNSRKGIILAGGSGTRLAPLTLALSKQLMPIYDKPMIYYTFSTLMLAGIKDILLITTPEHHSIFKTLLGDGSNWGISITYEIQYKPEGIAQAFIIGEKFIGSSEITLILGDNLFHGTELTEKLKRAKALKKGATIFAYPVNDPERYGVIEFNKKQQAVSLEEKPKKPKSKFVVTGLYFYDNSVVDRAKEIKPSYRGELEITDINKSYLKENNLYVENLGRGFAWLDTGTFDSLIDAGMYIETFEKRQGLKIGCPEEIAWRNGWIDDEALERIAFNLKKNSYGQYLIKLLKD